jgi:hypothetical protein
MFISLLDDGGFGITGVATPGDQGLTATADARLRGESVLSAARKQRIGMVAVDVPNACRTGEELKA